MSLEKPNFTISVPEIIHESSATVTGALVITCILFPKIKSIKNFPKIVGIHNRQKVHISMAF